MTVTSLALKIDLRGPKDAAGNSGDILQVSFHGGLEHEGVKYDLFCSCVPVVTVLNIGYYINQLNQKMEKGHTHISVRNSPKYQRADKAVYEAAKVDLYPVLLEKLREMVVFQDLNVVNVSE